MFDYLKHLYGELAGDILTKWQAAYPALAKAGLALLGALLIWAIFKRFMKRLQNTGPGEGLLCGVDYLLGPSRQEFHYSPTKLLPR
ncbi:MAG: hypothetical protein JRF18_07525 [Deltaproteobacteria bacterium]|nr:hypothetical protein [Deltaproteobacteria bacterium]